MRIPFKGHDLIFRDEFKVADFTMTHLPPVDLQNLRRWNQSEGKEGRPLNNEESERSITWMQNFGTHMAGNDETRRYIHDIQFSEFMLLIMDPVFELYLQQCFGGNASG
jgi:hypothetical protein